MSKKSELATAAATIEANMSAVRTAAESLRHELEADAAGLKERLLSKQKQKLSILQHDLSGYLVDLDAIDAFVKEALAQAGAPPNGVSAAQFAQSVVERQHELLSKGQRLSQRHVPKPTSVAADDLPNELGERQFKLKRLDVLEKLVKVKDEVVGTLVDEVELARRQHDEQSQYVARAAAYAEAVQSGAHEELTQWATTAEEATRKLAAAEAELLDTRREATELRRQNEEMRLQNDELRQHCDELRELVINAAGVPDGAAAVVAA